MGDKIRVRAFNGNSLPIFGEDPRRPKSSMPTGLRKSSEKLINKEDELITRKKKKKNFF